MIPSLRINEHCQTYSCWLAARHSQARIHTLNSPISAFANSARNLRAHLQRFANPHSAAKSSHFPCHSASTVAVPKSP